MGTELILPFLASVAVTLFLRRTDKSNYRLSQLKKFTQKLSEEVSQSAVNGIQSVKDATIDLDIMNKLAKKLISDIHQKTEETHDVLEALKSHKEYLDSITEDLKGVVRLAGDIRQESEYIQDGMKFLREQREEIRSVGSELNDVKSEVSRLLHDFNQKVDNRSNDILESLASKIVELESLLETKSDKIDESLDIVADSFKNKLSEETSAMISESVSKVEVMNAKLDEYGQFAKEADKTIEVRMTRFRDTTEALAEKIEKLDHRFEEKAETVGFLVQDKLSAFEKKFQERYENLYEQLKESKDALLEGFQMEIDSMRHTIESMSLETFTRRDEILNDMRRQAEQAGTMLTAFQEKYLDAENKLLRQADVKKNELFKEIARFEEEFKRITEDFNSETEDKRNMIHNTLSGYEAQIERAIASVEHSTKEKFLSLKNELEDTLLTLHSKKKSEMLEDLAAIESRIKELGRDTTNKIKNVDDHFFDLKNAMLESAKDILGQVEKEVSRISDNLDLEKSRTDERIEGFIASWGGELERIKSRAHKDIDALNDRLKDIHIEGKELTDSYRGEYLNAKSQLDQVLKKNSEILTAQTDAIVDEIQSRVKKSQDEAEILLGRLQKAGMNLYEKQEAHLSEYGEKLYKELQNKLEKIRYESEELLEDIQKAGNNLLEKQEEKIDKLNATIDERISRQLTALLDKGQLQLDQLESKITNYVQDVKNGIEYTLKHAKQDSERQIETFNSQIQKSFKDIEKANTDFLEHSRQEFNRTREEFSRVKSGLDSEIGKINDLKKNLFEYFSEESSKLKNAMMDIDEKVVNIEAHAVLVREAEKNLKESEFVAQNISQTLEKLKNENDLVSAYLKNAEFIRNAKKEMEVEIRILDTQKIKIEQIENELARVTSLANLITERTEELHDNIEKVTTIDNKLDEIEMVQSELESKLSEVRVVNERIGEITSALAHANKSSNDVNEKIQRVIREVEKLESKETDLAVVIDALEEKTTELGSRSVDFKSIETKFDKVESLMVDLSNRHKQVATMQKRIENLKEETDSMRSNFEKLLSDADDKFEKLSDFIKVVDMVVPQTNQGKQTNKNVKLLSMKDNADLIKRRKSTVLNLYQNFDWPAETIAEKLSMEKSLVDAIIHNNA